jgi:2-dehydropantoate 2-reductase
MMAPRHEVLLCGRRAASVTVKTPAGTSIFDSVLTDPDKAPVVDWVLVATKAYDSEAAARWFGRLRALGAPVAVLQNGVEHRERFAAHGPVVPVVVNCQAERHPGHVKLRGELRLIAPDDVEGPAFAALFAGTGVDAQTTEDFRTAAWRKLCVNVTAAISALALRPAGVFCEPDMARAAMELVRECAAVARAEGAHIDDSIADEVLAGLRSSPPDAVNSLLADRLAGRRLEVDARNGAVVRFAARHGILAPCNTRVVMQLAALPPLDAPPAMNTLLAPVRTSG